MPRHDQPSIVNLVPVNTGTRTDAASLMSTRVPRVHPTARVHELLASLNGVEFEAVADIVVIEGGRLVGILPLTRVFTSAPDVRVDELMDTDPPVLSPGVDRERVAWKAIEHGEVSIAVVQEDGTFLGLVPPRRLLSVLLAEHEEDLARLGGFGRSGDAARLAVSEGIARRLGHRLPWLGVGLAGAMLTAGVVGQYEDLLSRNVTLAFFVPTIVYMADAVGTQTETLIVRGLSVGMVLRRIVIPEAVTGALIGSIMGLLAFVLAWGVWGSARDAATLGIALAVACATATLVAVVLPGSLHRLGVDPAYGSGPLATMLQDLLSIMIYFMIAVALGA